jgi:antitoxin (DNA-binding transcriptional repressor) of toxin-antitoxin stability system
LTKAAAQNRLSPEDLVYWEQKLITVNIHEAKTQLSRLIEQAIKGETFIIAKAGKPLVKVEALDAPVTPTRLGFLKGEITVPRDFNRMGEAEIGTLFGTEK